MTLIDFIFAIVYTFLIVFASSTFVSIKKNNFFYRKYFVRGLIVKLFGGISVALVYTFYYTQGGDTISYFLNGRTLMELFINDPIAYIDILVSGEEKIFQKYSHILEKMNHHPGSNEWLTVKITSVIAIFGIGNFLSTTILFSFLSYIGIWCLYLVFVRKYPHLHFKLAIAVLYMPSVVFWGSGILKDCIVMGLLGFVVYLVESLMRKNAGLKIFRYLLIAISSYIIFYVKAYVIMALLPALLMWRIISVRDKIKSPFLNSILVPFLLIISVTGMLGVISILGTYNTKYSLDGIVKTASGMQSWHYVEGSNTSDQHGRGSSYSLGEYDESLLGLAKQFFPAVNVTLFRPYLWEVKNAVMLAAAVESMAILILSIFVIIKLKLFRVIKIMNKDSLLLMSFIFAILFAFAVGFSSYNFGALSRYKIPCIPFYVAVIMVLSDKIKTRPRLR